MSIFKLLGLKKNATRDEIKRHYIKKLLLVHPDRNKGLRDEYMELRAEYKKYVEGDDTYENSYSVCSRAEADSLVCRCGGKYELLSENLGRIECDYCSCFIELMDEPMRLTG